VKDCTERQELTDLICQRRQQLWNHLR
jgi:hypothetical protein